MAKKRSTYALAAERAQREVKRLRAEVVTLHSAVSLQNERETSLREVLSLKNSRVAVLESETDRLKKRPTQVRRVVRTLVIAGDPVWVANTLQNSLPQGMTDLGQGAITLTTIEDATQDVRPLGRADRRG